MNEHYFNLKNISLFSQIDLILLIKKKPIFF